MNPRNAEKTFVYFDDRRCLEYLLSAAGRVNPLPAISIACSPACNLACPHCIYNAGKPSKDGLATAGKLHVLEDAIRLGARFLQICHDGEPLVDPSTLPLLQRAAEAGMRIFLYSNGTQVTPETARFLYERGVCLGIKCDSMDHQAFDRMLGMPGSTAVFRGIRNLLHAGYGNPIERDGRLYTRLGLVCTLTSINIANLEGVKQVARFCWEHNLFFGAARLERGGRARGQVWDTMRVQDPKEVMTFIEWCSAQTGINYWDAQPNPYCIGVCGMQVADNGDVWTTDYGGSCDFTEPDGENYPERLVTVGNVRREPLDVLLRKLWDFRRAVVQSGALARKLAAYRDLKDVYPNGLQDCGSARTYTLFLPFYDYVSGIVNKGGTPRGV